MRLPRCARLRLKNIATDLAGPEAAIESTGLPGLMPARVQRPWRSALDEPSNTAFRQALLL